RFEEFFHAPGKPVLTYAMGDGNHSLATAKACWEKLKPTLSPQEQETHPARYALVELVNLHDDSLEFEPIHRVVFGVDPQKLLADLLAAYPGAHTGEGEGHQFTYVLPGERGTITVPNPTAQSTETGEPVLLVDSARLTLERTAATTALAVRYLAKNSAKRLAIIGTGAQALAHLRYVAGLRDWQSVRIWSLNSAQLTQEQKSSFIHAGHGKVEFTSTKSEALQDADVILLCTSAADAVIGKGDFTGAPLITSISTNVTDAHEIDPALLSEMAVFCDCTATTASVAGEMRLAAQAGLWSPSEVMGDLGDLVNGRCRRPEDKTVFFRSIGQGLEDIAIALAVLEQAKAMAH
ncbi:MAG TPA: DUF1015 family protein, partial [Candidatus Aphodousia faecipullorum]|nr:DUF1015 family protein [Candidatus Aphodousia faecipullorum]